MTKLELKTALSELKWTQSELARVMCVTPETVSRWSDVPVIVGLYLELLIESDPVSIKDEIDGLKKLVGDAVSIIKQLEVKL